MDWLDLMLFAGMDHPAAAKRTRAQLRELDRRLARRIRRQGASQEQRIEALETALGRVAMLARALAELGLAKGAFTQEELERALFEADLADGATDGGLDPDVALPGEERAADLEPLDDGA